MNFYSFEEINSAGACIRFVKEVLGYDVNHDNRCQAKWRGGDGFNVALNEHGWFDHKTKEKGGIIDLCAMVKFGGTDMLAKQSAQEMLGEWLGLTPKNKSIRKTFDYQTQSARYQELVQKGFTETKKYTYTNEDGTPCHFVIRMEHPTERKQFIQCTPYSGSLRDVQTYLYNLPVIKNSDWAIIVEGEKDAETLIQLGLPATTCNNGSDHWKDEYTESLRGKDIVICRDNDDAGNDHAHLLLRSLANAARSLRVICPSKLPKGDVTDWISEEGGNKKKFYELMTRATLITAEEAMWSDEALMLYRAKKANEIAFSNYSIVEKLVKGKPQIKEVPRTINEMVEDVHTRFLGFPRRIGQGTLFDHDRDTNKIELLQSNASTFAWIGEKSKHAVQWKTGHGFVTKEEFYCALIRNTVAYEKISEVPNFPMRSDVYYTFRDKLKASPEHKMLNTYMMYFCPEDEASELLMKTMLAGMMYYRPGIQRPCWIIDSKGGQAAGKTTFAELACYLYKCKPIKTNMNELMRDAKELNKRLVSVTGRNSMMLLVDNVRGTFDNPFFADLVTGFDISGKAPYGIGEESRPNDLTYVITSNSANIGSDMASRSFIFYVAQPKERKTNWKESVMRFIDKYRYEILGDIYDILDNGVTPDVFNARTRVPEFEAQVLYKVAGNDTNYAKVIDSVLNSRDTANVDEELAIQAVEIVREKLKEHFEKTSSASAFIDVDSMVVFVRSQVINLWLKKTLNIDIQDIRNMINTGRIKCMLREPQRYPAASTSNLRASGVLFFGNNAVIRHPAEGNQIYNSVDISIIAKIDDNKLKTMATLEDRKIGEIINNILHGDEIVDTESKIVQQDLLPDVEDMEDYNA